METEATFELRKRIAALTSHLDGCAGNYDSEAGRDFNDSTAKLALLAKGLPE